MQILFKCIAITAVAIGSWWVWDHREELFTTIMPYVENGEFLTLEARFTPEQIMEAHRTELLADARYTYQEPKQLFYPYLLMQVKYPQGPEKKTKEGMLLWSLVDGEMVLNSESWETSHGFEDAIIANANANDFALLGAIAKKGGTANRDQLQKDLRLDQNTLDRWVDDAKKKHLILVRGADLQLHFQNPLLPTMPETKTLRRLVKKPYASAERVTRRYRKNDVEKILTAAFGPDFAIRSFNEVYLPVYSLDVLNPDGSHHISLWNAITNKTISSTL